MSVVDELVIRLGLDGSGAKKGIADAKNAINGGISDITANLKGLAAEFAAAFAIKAAFSTYTAEADAMGKLADAMGINIENLHSWSEAAIRAGGSAEGFQASLQALNGQLVRTGLTGQSRAKMVLEGAGIDAGDVGRTRDAFEVMQDLAAKAETMSKGEFMGLGRSLGLDTGTIMLLQQGRGTLKDAVQTQKELGVYTKEDARVTADWNDRIADSAQAFKALMAVIFREVLPAFTAIVKGFNSIVSTIRKHDVFVKAFFVMVATIIMTMLIPAFASLATAILANPITWVAVALMGIAAVIEDLVVWAQGGESALEDLWSAMFGSPEKAIQTFNDIKNAITGIIDAVTPIAKAMFTVWSTITKTVTNIVYGLIVAIMGFIADFISWLFGNNDDLGGSFARLCERISSVFENAFNSIKDLAGSAADAIIKAFTSAFDWIASKWNSIKSMFSLSPISVNANVSASGAIGGNVGGRVNNIDSDTSIGNINVYTQATDADGISRDIGSAVNDNVGGYYAQQANVGVD